MLNVEIFPAVSNVFLQLSKAELFLHFKNVEMFPTFWKCRNISSIFQNVFLQLSKAELFLHFKNVEMFLTFWKCRKFPTFFQCVSAVAKS